MVLPNSTILRHNLNMPAFTDPIGHIITIDSPPRRIISLVPSQTELLYHLGLEQQVIGITKFCVHPEHWHKTKTRIGGTKNIHADIIESLQPDLIIANKEENLRDQVEALYPHYPVWTSDVHDLPSAIDTIEMIGELTGTKEKARSLTNDITRNFQTLTENPQSPKTAYLIWRKPYMSIGGDTFIHDMLVRAGFDNILASQTRYPTITLETLKEQNTRLILLSSEPYPFKETHIAEIQEALPEAKIILVDGELFSWYGPRLLKAPAYFQAIRNSLSQNIDL